MRKSNFALRLQPSLLDEARKLAEAEGVALNQLINVAVAEKVSALRTESYIAARADRANVPKALTILKLAGASGAARRRATRLPRASPSSGRRNCHRKWGRCKFQKDKVGAVEAHVTRLNARILIWPEAIEPFRSA